MNRLIKRIRVWKRYVRMGESTEVEDGFKITKGLNTKSLKKFQSL